MFAELALWLYNEISYFWVFILMTIESTFIPFPSEVVVAPAAFKAAHGDMNIYLVVLWATLGADLGAAINYWLAYYLGRPAIYAFARSRWAKLFLLDEGKIVQSERYFERRGVVATLIGRLLPVIRQLISVPAGLARMNFSKFILFTTIGAGSWNIILAIIGYSMGAAFGKDEFEAFMQALTERSHQIGYGILAIVVIAAIVWYVAKTFKKKHEQHT
ncbi:MAG: DedA family protein [Bacteroidales bacterium]|nr:DedA family protein [Bacteroidales bacterium]